jgi:hypothetical protein
MNRNDANVTRLRVPDAASTADATAVRLGRIVAAGKDGGIVVTMAGLERPVEARLGIAAAAGVIREAVDTSQTVVLVLEDGDPAKPIIIGFVAALTPEPPAAADQTPAKSEPSIEADVDGRRIRISAQDEIVLACGAASVTLRRNGRVIIRGTHVETHSDGTNRIKGAQVRIN